MGVEGCSPLYAQGLNELGGSICYGEPVGSTTVNSWLVGK